MNKQQMEQIIYEEFVNNIYERANFNLSEEKTRMIEEFMRQIFNEAEATAKKDSNLPQEPESDAKSPRQINLEPQPRPQDSKDKPVADKAKGNDGPATAGAEKEPEAAKAADKKPEVAADVAKDPEDKKDAQQVTKQVVYVIQQAEPQNFRQFMKKHGIIGGILKKTFELAFGTDVWRDPADARYFLSGVYQNPYNAPMLAVQFLQQNREQILAAAGNDPNITQVANQIATAGKKAAAKTEADPEKEKLDATEDERTDVDDVLSGDGEEKPEEVPGEETEEPGEETPGEEEAKALVPKDDIELEGNLGTKKEMYDRWNAANLHDAPPGRDRILISQNLLSPPMLTAAVKLARQMDEARKKKNKNKKSSKGTRRSRQERRREFNNRMIHVLGKEGSELRNLIKDTNLQSFKADGLFGKLAFFLKSKGFNLSDILLEYGPEVFARAMAGLADQDASRMITFFDQAHRNTLQQYLDREKQAGNPSKKPAPAKDRGEGTPLIPPTGEPQDQEMAAEGMQAFMEKKQSTGKRRDALVGKNLLNYVLKHTAKALDKKPVEPAPEQEMDAAPEEEAPIKKQPTARDNRYRKQARHRPRRFRSGRDSYEEGKERKIKEIKKSSLTQENIVKAVTEWHANKGITLQEGKAKKIAESILKVIK